MTLTTELGPLEPLVGTWEGDQGLDVSYHHADAEVGETPYFERTSFSAFGPVENGDQALYGLDYRMKCWRIGEEHDEPFHTEVGYWLWDAEAGQVMRCFTVHRGVVIIAGGAARTASRHFVMRAEMGSDTYGILQSEYLIGAARAVHYQVSVELDDGLLSYDEITVLQLTELDEQLDHTDRNVLHRVH